MHCRATLHHEVERVEDAATDDARKVPLRIYTPKNPSNKLLPVLVYFHGGGWVTGESASMHGLKILNNVLSQPSCIVPYCAVCRC